MSVEMAKCPTCNGQGWKDPESSNMVRCTTCDGAGILPANVERMAYSPLVAPSGLATELLNFKTRSMALDLLAIGGYIPKPRLRQAIRIAKRALAQTPNAPHEPRRE